MAEIMADMPGIPDIPGISVDKQKHKHLHNSLDYLLEKYKDNDYISARIINYIEHIYIYRCSNALAYRRQGVHIAKNIEQESQ